MSQAKTVMNILSNAQLRFIEAELGIRSEQIRGMSDDAIDDMYDKLCDIEIAETAVSENSGEAYSLRGRMAEGIVTAVGNALYRPEDEEA